MLSRMNVLSWCTPLAVLALLAASATAPAATLEGHWNLNSNALDDSGNGRDGTVLGATNLSVSSPDPITMGLAGDFDPATDDAINVGNAGFGSLTSNYSIVGWVKPEVVNIVQRMFSSSRAGGNTGEGFGLNGDDFRHTTYGIKDYNQATTVNAWQWQHIAVVVDSAFDATFYLNGVAVGTQLHNAPGLATLNDFFIGRTTPNGSSTPSEEFNGRIDDVRFYSGTLTGGEVQSLATIPNLFAYYGMDETSGTFAGDSSGYHANGNLNGVYQGGAALNQPTVSSSPAGQFGTAVRFDGTNDEVYLGSNAARQNELKALTSNFTVAAWINPDNLDGIQRILSQNAANGNGWGFGLFGSQLRFTTYLVQDFNIAANIQAGVWTHVAVVFDANFDATFYVNGVSIGTVLGSAAANVGTANWFIGSTGVQEYFDGFIDEVRIYNTVLSEGQIALLAAVVPAPAAAPAGLAVLSLLAVRRRHRRTSR